MEHVLKVLLQFCKDYCEKNAPSKKDIHEVISQLEQEGEIKAPRRSLITRDGMISPPHLRSML